MVQIARSNLALALECYKEVNELSETLKNMEGYEAEYFLSKKLAPAKNKLSNYCSVALVFSALAIEGYIYDYAVRKLTDKFVDSHLEKLDVVSKWVVIPKLTTGKDFPKDGQAFNLLRKLVRNRNYLVHNKSVKLMKADSELNLTGNETSENLTKILYSESAIRMLEFDDSILDMANAAIKTLDELAVVMESLDPDERTSFVFRSPVGHAKEQYTKLGVWSWHEDEQ